MGPPILSIVTPALNGGQYFEACLASVERLADALPGRVEHIVADGGSVDGTLSRARSALASPASPVSLVLEGPDRGQSHAINRGFERARGSWFAWLNADDEYVPAAVSLFERAVTDRYHHADVVVGRCRFVDEAGRVVFEPLPPDLTSPADMLRPLTKWFAGRCIVQPEVVFRRDAFERAGGLDESNHLAMDHDLWLRMLGTGARFVVGETQVAVQHVHADQKTVNNLGVAKQILANCDRFVLDHGSPSVSGDQERETLRERIRVVERIMRSRRGALPMRREAFVASIRAAVGALREPAGSVLVVGDAAYQAVRAAGWDAAKIVRVSQPLPGDGRFDAAVFDCSSIDVRAARMPSAWACVRRGGVLVLGGCPIDEELSRVRSGIERMLGDRVTRAGEPWSAELLDAAATLLGWTASCRVIPAAPGSGFELVRRVPAQMAAATTDAIRALGLRVSDLAETRVLRRRSSVVQ